MNNAQLAQQSENGQSKLTKFNPQNCDIIWKATFDDRLKQADIRILCLLLASNLKNIYSVRAIGIMIGKEKDSTWRAIKRLIACEYLLEINGKYLLNLSTIQKPEQKEITELEQEDTKPKDDIIRIYPGTKHVKLSNNQAKELKEYYVSKKLETSLLRYAVEELDIWLSKDESKKFREENSHLARLKGSLAIDQAKKKQEVLEGKKTQAEVTRPRIKLFEPIKIDNSLTPAEQRAQIKELRQKHPEVLGVAVFGT